MSSSTSEAEMGTPPSGRSGAEAESDAGAPGMLSVGSTGPGTREGRSSTDLDDPDQSDVDRSQPISSQSSGSALQMTAPEGTSSDSSVKRSARAAASSPHTLHAPISKDSHSPRMESAPGSSTNIQERISPSSDRTEEVVTSFKCQRCSQPITLDAVVANIDEQTFIELTGLRKPFYGQRDLLREQQKQQSNQEGNNDFYLVGHNNGSQGNEESSDLMGVGQPSHGGISPSSFTDENYHRKLVISRLFDILTDQSDVKHPLCEDCAEKILNDMDSELRTLEDECTEYKNKLDELRSDMKPESETAKETEMLLSQVADLEVEERKLREELSTLEVKEREVERDLEDQQAALRAQHEDEDKYWREFNYLKHALYGVEDELASVDNEYRYVSSQLDKLKRTSVLKATFFIMPSGQFGTINGLRLGRLPNVPVEWSEINAAWGQGCLLLASLARKSDFEFTRYRLVPYGNYSRIECLEEGYKELPLYGTGGIRGFWTGGFDNAMVAFLDCLAQLNEEIERGDPSFMLPYVINAAKGRIEDVKNKQNYSIKLQFNNEENWTKALKYMLTNMKWLLEWISSWER